jgi:hypothetical protein
VLEGAADVVDPSDATVDDLVVSSEPLHAAATRSRVSVAARRRPRARMSEDRGMPRHYGA